MRSILFKILGLLAIFNVALWIFFLLSDDYLDLEVEHTQNQLSLNAIFFAKIIQPTLEDTTLSDFEKSVEIQGLLSDKNLLGADKLRIYRFEGKDFLSDTFAYYDATQKLKYAPIQVSDLEVILPEKTDPTPLERLFEAFKPVLDDRILTEPIVVSRARYTRQSEVLDNSSDNYSLRVLHPVRSGAKTLALIEVWDSINIKEAYIGRNDIRLTLLGGVSLMTLLLGFMLAISIAFPLRRLARRLDQKLTPDDVAEQLKKFSIARLQGRKDEIGSLHKNLVKLTSQVTKLFEEKERFASEVAHELKNPIASIIAYSENMPEGSPQSVHEGVAKIKEQAVRMSKLVSEISEGAIVDNDLVTKKREKFDLAEVTQTIADHYRDLGEHPKLIIETDIPKKVIVNGLPDRFGQVIVNLLDNAISFVRPVGTVRIRLVKHWRHGISMVVEDSGPGVREEIREAIFDRFFTARSGNATIPNSSGLGLYICRQIIEAHGGKITVDASELGGAKFEIRV